MNNPLGIPDELKILIDAGLDADSSPELKRWAAERPENARLLKRVVEVNHLFDEQVRQCMEQVTVPSGSAERTSAFVKDQAFGKDYAVFGGSGNLDETTKSDVSADMESLPIRLQAIDSSRPEDPLEAVSSQPNNQIPRGRQVRNRKVQLRRRRIWKSLAALAAVVLVGLFGLGVYQWNHRELVDSSVLARQSQAWTVAFEDQSLQPEPPAAVEHFPKCRDLRYDRLPPPQFCTLQTEFGLARGMMWTVPRGDPLVGFGKAYLLSFPLTQIQQWTHLFDMGSRLPRNAIPSINSHHLVAASFDREQRFVHILIVEPSLQYQEIVPPKMEFSLRTTNWLPIAISLQKLPRD